MTQNREDTGVWPPPVIDIEASGFGRAGFPIEVGLILPDGRAWCTLVRPPSDWTHWDPVAQDLHGITREQLTQHGMPVDEVARALNQWLSKRQVYTDSWAHDYPWLHRIFDAAGTLPRFRLESVRILLDEDQASRWASTRLQVSRSMHTTRHRASHDARVVQQTVAALLPHAAR